MTAVPVAGQTFTFGIGVGSQADTNVLQAAPAIAAGDIRRSINGAAFANLDNLPTVNPAGGKRIEIVLSAAETTAAGAGGEIFVLASDAAGTEWQDVAIGLRVYAADVDDLPADIWSYTTRTLTSFGTLVADITAAISAILCNVWSCSTRTLTVGLAHLKTALLGDNLEVLRGDTLILNITGLGDISARTNLWFTIKKKIEDADTVAELQVDENTGLLYIAGAAATAPANASITVTDPVRGNFTLRVEADEMKKLDLDFIGYFDVQVDTAGTISTPKYGNAQIIGDVTRATS